MKIVNISTLYQHICDETAVGSANGPAHPAGAGLVAQGWLSQQAARARDDTGYAYILSHVGHTQDAEDRIKAHKLEVLTGAPTAAAVAAADAAIAAAIAANAAVPPPAPLVAIPAAAVRVANTLPVDWLPQLWRWICTDLGPARASGLLTLNENSVWDNLKMIDVGIDRDTLSRLHAHINR